MAVLVQQEASKPIGEGDVFINDARTAAAHIESNADPDVAVRAARNDLGVEAVSVLDASGNVIASTSSNKVGYQLSNQLLLSAVENQRFTAVALAIESPIVLDGIETWPTGTVLYQVVHPLEEASNALLIHYDVPELLGRRTKPGELQPATLQLAGAAATFAILGVLAIFGRGRTARRYEAIELESSFLRRHSAELEQTNADLEEARKAAEEALELAEEKIRIRSEFVLMINHELRTPLTSVVTGAELVRSADLDDNEKASLIDSMVQDGNRLLEIIDQILAVARIENRGLSREMTEHSIEELCALVSASRAPNQQADELRIKTDLSALKLVVGSLVDNARTHGATRVDVVCSAESTISPDLEVGSRPESAAFVAVADDGPGIDPEFLPRIFEKFEKSSFSSGTGLGLYMARMVIDALDGSLAVQTSSAGTTFEIALPAIRVRSEQKVTA